MGAACMMMETNLQFIDTIHVTGRCFMCTHVDIFCMVSSPLYGETAGLDSGFSQVTV